MAYHTDRAVELDSLYLGIKTDHGRLQSKYYGGSLDICYTDENDHEALAFIKGVRAISPN